VLWYTMVHLCGTTAIPWFTMVYHGNTMVIPWYFSSREPRAWRKLMAAYRRVYGFGHLRADCRGPGSDSESYACFELLHTELLNLFANFDLFRLTDDLLLHGCPFRGRRITMQHILPPVNLSMSQTINSCLWSIS